MEYEFLEILSSVVTIEKRVSATANGYAQPSYGPPKQYPANLQPLSRFELRMIRTPAGDELHSGTVAYVATDWLLVNGVPTKQTADVISPGDRLTLPDGSQPPLLMVEPNYDEIGLHHTVLYA